MTSTLPDFVRAGAEARVDEPPPEDKLTTIRAKAAELRGLYVTLAGLQESVANVTAAINLIEGKELVDMMVEARMPDFSLEAEGNYPPASFKRRQLVSASVPEERRGEAYVWLEENGHVDLIKNEFKVAFGMGDGKQAEKLDALLKKNKYEFSRKVSVLPQSLTARVKKELEAGRQVANDLLGVYVGERVEVTLGGEKVKKAGKK